MKNFIIIIIIHRFIQLTIHPFLWRLIPGCHSDASLGDRKESVYVKVPMKSQGHGYKLFNRKYEVGFITTWLCFTFQCTYMKKSEHIHRIYPRKYNCDTDPAWHERYNSLLETDYFQ